VQDPLGIKLAQAYKRTGNLAKAKTIDSVIKISHQSRIYKIKKHCRNDFKKTYITFVFLCLPLMSVKAKTSLIMVIQTTLLKWRKLF
jgi:hypothetical protein